MINTIMSPMKSPLPFSIIWLAALSLFFVFASPLAEELFLFYLPIHWGVFLLGCIIAAVGLFTWARNWARGVVRISICVLGMLLFFTVGFDWGRYVLFQLRKPTYQQQLAEATQLGSVPVGQGQTENGPPKLHAFYWQRGVVDN